MEYQAEFIKDILPEVAPLIKEHWEELTKYRDIPLNPNFEQYIQLQNANSLLFVTVRDKGKVIGYCSHFIYYHMHSKDHVCAIHDLIFISKQYRNGFIARKLIRASEEILRHIGVSFMTLTMNSDKPFERLAISCGFEEHERVFSKNLRRV